MLGKFNGLTDSEWALLSLLQVERPNLICTTDTTYPPMKKGFAYLAA
jgi:hypothetical protein